jgi:hypothetical protein
MIFRLLQAINEKTHDSDSFPVSCIIAANDTAQIVRRAPLPSGTGRSWLAQSCEFVHFPGLGIHPSFCAIGLESDSGFTRIESHVFSSAVSGPIVIP